MVSLRLFAIVLISLICQQIAGEQPWIEWKRSLLATIGISLGFGLLVKSLAMRAYRQGVPQTDSRTRYDRFHQSRRAAELLWCCFLPAALLASGWASWLKVFENCGMLHVVATLGVFFPALVFLFLVEMTSAQVDELHEEAETGQGTAWQSNLMLRLRLGDLAGLVTCITPVLLIATFTDLHSFLTKNCIWLAIDPRWATGAAALCLLGLFLLVFPVAFSRWAGARGIEDTSLSNRLRSQMQQLGLRGIEPMIVHSGGRWMGAAIVGWFPWFRKLWLSDALVESLDSKELDMVVLHELAHVERRHFLWRTLPVMFTAVLSIALWIGLQQLVIEEAVRVVLQMIVLSTGGFMVVVTLGTVARFCELDADRRACELARQCCPWSSVESSEEVLSSVLANKVLGGSEASKATWLHPSLADRLSNLSTSETRPLIEACTIT